MNGIGQSSIRLVNQVRTSALEPQMASATAAAELHRYVQNTWFHPVVSHPRHSTTHMSIEHTALKATATAAAEVHSAWAVPLAQAARLTAGTGD